MSFIARYLSCALSRLSFELLDSYDIPASPRIPSSAESPPLSPSAPTLARGLILSTSPYLKSTAADPKISLTPVTVADPTNTSSSSFDNSFSSDTSSSSSCSEDTLITPLRSLDKNDLFSPRHDVASNSLIRNTPSPPHLVGLGISGISRRDGKPGGFDGLGLVGIRRSFNSKDPFLIFADDDDDDDGYVSPTPIRAHRRDNDKRDEPEQDDGPSETFMRELVFTWESDPQHTRMLSTIPECDNEDELEFSQAAMKEMPDPSSSPASFSSPSPSLYHSASCPPSPLSTPSPLTLQTATRPHLTQAFIPTRQAKSELQGSRVSPRNLHSSHTRSSSIASVSTRGRTIMRAKNPTGLRSGRGGEAVGALSKKKSAVKNAWRA